METKWVNKIDSRWWFGGVRKGLGYGLGTVFGTHFFFILK
jgi:hypothetical protein